MYVFSNKTIFKNQLYVIIWFVIKPSLDCKIIESVKTISKLNQSKTAREQLKTIKTNTR